MVSYSRQMLKKELVRDRNWWGVSFLFLWGKTEKLDRYFQEGRGKWRRQPWINVVTLYLFESQRAKIQMRLQKDWILTEKAFGTEEVTGHAVRPRELLGTHPSCCRRFREEGLALGLRNRLNLWTRARLPGFRSLSPVSHVTDIGIRQVPWFTVPVFSSVEGDGNINAHCIDLSLRIKWTYIDIYKGLGVVPDNKSYSMKSFLRPSFLKHLVLFIWPHQVWVVAQGVCDLSYSTQDLLVAACKLLVTAHGVQFPDQGSNPSLLHWDRGVLATGPPGKPLRFPLDM